MEGRKLGFEAEVLLGCVQSGPLVGALGGYARRHDAVDEVDAFGQAHGCTAPALQDGRVQHHHALRPLRVLTGQHEAEVAAQGVSDEVGGVADLLDHEVAQLGDKVWPVGRDRVAWVVPVLLDGVDGVALVLPALEDRLVGARRETVGVRKNDGAMESGRGHGVVAFGRHDGDVMPCGGKRYFQAKRLV